MNRYILIIFLLFTACTSTKFTPAATTNSKNIYVIKYSWHSAVIIKKDDIPQNLIPEKNDFNNANYLEFGWGNKAFFQSKEFHLGLATKALFIPGDSTLYVYGIEGKPQDEYEDSQVILLKFTPEQFAKILEKIDQSFVRKGGMRAPITLKGHHGGNFYDAHGAYGIFKTCNNWTAEVLKSGDLPISTSIYSSTAKNIISQSGKYGEVLKPSLQP